MNQEMLDRIEESTYAVKIIWSTLEAVAVAMNDENAVCETYCDAIRGTADYAYQTKNHLNQMLIEINQ